jgi:anti-sigma regulatory factor (Ser/Thr protein kinase)
MTPLSALPSAPSCARAEVHAALTMWDMSNLTEAAELVVTKLATNAVRAAGRSGQPSSGLDRPTPVILICLLADRGRLRIETWDQAPGFPVLREAPADAEFGRGLALVDAITEGRWGWHPAASAQVGKCVWAEISNPIH